MTDQSAHHADTYGRAPHRRVPKAEYATYFLLILVFALPVQALGWLWQVLRHQRMPAHGPLARALRDAEEITPAIFRP